MRRPVPRERGTGYGATNGEEVLDREEQAEAEVPRTGAQPLRALRARACVPAALRRLPHLLPRAGAERDDPRRAEGELVARTASAVGKNASLLPRTSARIRREEGMTE